MLGPIRQHLVVELTELLHMIENTKMVAKMDISNYEH